MGTLCDFLSVICPAKHIFKLRNLTQDVRQVLVCRRKESAVEWTRVLLCWQKHKRHLTITLITTLSSVGLRLTLKILSKMVQICRLIWDLNCGLRSMLQVLHHKTGLTSGPAQIVVRPPVKKALFSFIRLAPGKEVCLRVAWGVMDKLLSLMIVPVLSTTVTWTWISNLYYSARRPMTTWKPSSALPSIQKGLVVWFFIF